MLTDTRIKRLKPADKVYKETDSQGLYLEVRKSGAKFFRFRYRHPLTKKEQVFTIGEYPAVGLALARMERDQAKELLARGIDPNEQKQAAKQEVKAAEQEKERLASRMTFKELFEEWHLYKSESWTYYTAKKNRERIEGNLLPNLGNYPLEEITPEIARDAFKAIEATGKLETLRKVKQFANAILQYGVGMGHCAFNPVRDLPTDIFKAPVRKNFAFLTATKDLHQLLNDLENYKGHISVKTALLVQPYIFLRPDELAGLEWADVDFYADIITIPAERMKMSRPHVVPMSKQVQRLLMSIKDYSEKSRYVFPSPRTFSKSFSEQSLNAGLHRLGYNGKQTAHGFRHTASTLLNEMGFNRDHIEKQLAHEEGNKVRGTYNKAEYLAERIKMMQVWADHLDSIKAGADVVPIHGKLKS
ncbi:tyrosine-type recombinase/integrase [Thiomicrorhabdus xiamenensis]|uniref:Integrase arm-type DNA-binding domain-containing protein n=1 Tax=Thiomicrorhabdus xiamenensis TaxID=2739063 RepID=A0A7D4TBT3_9GAMM|nr:integrase arm-type DNA-binding domain-containing protein [Thiomicrorhabdus xiamenensis]QKI89926.1 integrase arm-type DNA-binding domain-containing protein [Thiomicrorhabdus xiamenensis]